MLLWGCLPAPGLHLPGGQRQTLSGTWRDRGPLCRLLVRGELCQPLAQPNSSLPSHPPSHSPGRQQGCSPRAGERRPWEPGAGADLSPGSEQPVSAQAHSAFGPAAGWFLWLLSCLHCRPWDLGPMAPETWAALAQRGRCAQDLGQNLCGVDFTEAVRTRFESRLSVELSEPHLSSRKRDGNRNSSFSESL